MPQITLEATSVFWFAPENRHVFPGQQITIPDSDFPLYAAVAKHLVAGKLPGGRPPKFTDRLVTKTKEVLGLAPPAEDQTRFECAHCKQVFKAAKGLEIHLKNAHPEAAQPRQEAKSE